MKKDIKINQGEKKFKMAADWYYIINNNNNNSY